MTAESLRTRNVLGTILALAVIAVVARHTFVDLLTKTTGTWVGGVESPPAKGRGAD